MEHNKKFTLLLSSLREAESAVLAFSGGVDSSFLLKAMKLSGIRAIAVTAASETVPAREVDEAASFAADEGMKHLIIRTEEISNEMFVNNGPDRCFHCKDELFGKLNKIASAEDYRFVFDGGNADDLHDYRPGRKAAEKHGVRSPLAECGFTKNEIREMSRELGLGRWDRPSSPCLSSRFPYGRRITAEALRRVEKSEDFLRKLGFTEVRVRDNGDSARIEVGEQEIARLLASENRRVVTEALKSFGYLFVSLDLEGYRSGSMNKVLGRKGTIIPS